MKEIKEAKIEIEEPIFDQLRSDINAMLRRTIGMMTMKNTEDAVITIKIPVHIEKQNIPDGGISREAPVPSFKHEISSVMQVKDKMSGQSKGEYELVWDDDGNPMYRDINNGQTSIWDDDGLVDIEEDSYASQDSKSLGAPSMRGLPETASEEVKDAEFTEVETPEEADEEKAEEAAEEKAEEPAAEKPEDYPHPTQKGRLPKPCKKGGREPFDWLMQFRNEEMTIVETKKGYRVTAVSDGTIVLATTVDEDNPFYVKPEKVKKHVGHKIICLTYPEEVEEGKDPDSIDIWCDDPDCGDFIFGIPNPDKEDTEDYKYDEPEQ